MTPTFSFAPGTTPLLVSLPHGGTELPEAIARRMTEAALRLPDTDWHIGRLYDFAGELGAGVLAARQSRYVVDLNRDPEDTPLYPGADNTGLCPTTTFDAEPIWLPGEEPGAIERAARIDRYWRPYHARIAEELERLRARFGVAVLFDGHSIRSQVPRFFAGRLPDFNLGTASGKAADPDLARRALAVVGAAAPYTAVLDGRFTGGHITRSFGAPAQGVHAVQLELVQATYMTETWPFAWRQDLAEKLRPVLRSLLREILAWAEARTPPAPP